MKKVIEICHQLDEICDERLHLGRAKRKQAILEVLRKENVTAGEVNEERAQIKQRHKCEEAEERREREEAKERCKEANERREREETVPHSLPSFLFFLPIL